MDRKPRLKLSINGVLKNITMMERHGGKFHNCKLSDEQVQEVRRRYAISGASVRRVAAEMGVGKSTVADIVQRRTYKVVP